MHGDAAENPQHGFASSCMFNVHTDARAAETAMMVCIQLLFLLTLGNYCKGRPK
jgi:hypothetical protein